MSTRIEEILRLARITLADQDKQRWSDDDLLAFLNEAHIDFATETQLLAGRVEIPVTIGDPYFDLPEDVWLITRVLLGTTNLPLVSHTELDYRQTISRLGDFGLTPSDEWEADKGQPAAFLYDRRNQHEGKLYPVPDESLVTTSYIFADRFNILYQDIINDALGVYTGEDSVDSAFGVAGSSATGLYIDDYDSDFGIYSDSSVTVGVNGAGDEFVGNGLLGVTVGIDNCTFNSDFGVVASTYEPGIIREFYSSDFGVIADMSENTGILYIYYVKCPQSIVSVLDTLDTSPMWDKALKYYVVGHAFLVDIDTEYQSKGMEQLQLYERELLKAKKTERRDSTRAGQFNTDYRRVV